jgi:hypothetical protein
MEPVSVRWPKIMVFAWRVLRDFFFRNHGLLIKSSSAVAHGSRRIAGQQVS